MANVLDIPALLLMLDDVGGISLFTGLQKALRVFCFVRSSVTGLRQVVSSR